LGVNTIWLCPCYKSPNYDNGYDISDYRDIMDDFGTFEDWKRLITQMHARGMKLLMDLVVNHTSSHHEWFKQARSSRNNPYHDYYIWSDKPLNNWESCFGGSAWEYNEQTNEYYLHSFAVQQPDLNWENPKVRKECCDIVDFWVQLGVDGFRCDVLDYISKDLTQVCMYNGPKLHEYIRELFGREEVSHIFTIGECQSDEKSIVDICGPNRNELTTIFQFEHIVLGREATSKYIPRPFTYDEVRNVLVSWQHFTEKHDLLYVLFTDNHDQPFYLSRMGNDREYRYECATMYATAFYLLRGIPFIYQGQEFGSANPYYTDISFFNDVETLNYYHANKTKLPNDILMEQINYGSRDNTRRPMAWTGNESTMYGFTSGKPWLAPNSRAKEINAERDKQSEKSVFAFYKKLLALRKENEIIRRGTFTDLTNGRNDCFVYRRDYNGKNIIVVCNFQNAKTIELPNGVTENNYKQVLTNYLDGVAFSSSFRPFEIAVYEEL
jgi:oligo-1,6-glucosidase